MSDKVVFILSLFDTGLYTAHLFKKYGYEVVGFDFNVNNSGFRSKALAAVRIDDPSVNSSSVVHVLISKALRYNVKPLLVAASEVFLNLLINYQSELLEHFQLVMPTPNVLNNIIRKSGQFSMARNSNLSVPKHCVVSDYATLGSLKVDIVDYPVIIKGDDQQNWKKERLPKSFMASCYSELKATGQMLLDRGVSFIVQEMVDGPITNNYEYNALCLDGQIVMESTIQKIRQLTIPYGAASCVKLQKNDQVSALGRRFVLGNGVDGFSNTEFKLNPRDGKYYFIECNARVWMQIKLTEHIKLSYIKAYIDFLSSKCYRYYETHYDKQVYWVDFPYDLISCLNGFMLSPKRALKQIRSYLHARSFGLLSLHDLNPLISKLCKK